MKNRLIIFVLIYPLFSVGLFFYIQPGKGPVSDQPQVTFRYAKNIDRLCPPPGRSNMTAEWRTELPQKIADLEQQWEKSGPALLLETTRLIGHPFAHEFYSVPVFMCPSLIGWGLPLMVPVGYYLAAAHGEYRWLDAEFVGATFHELLHMYVIQRLHWSMSTPMLKKYSEEGIYTKLHLHLYALQKQVYENLERQEEWQITVARAKSFPAQFSRAIEIVESEGAAPFVEELK